MQRIGTVIVSAAVAALLVTGSAKADEVGGSGFTVPQNEWLWGIEGLVRTPVDLSVDLGVSFYGWEVDGEAHHDDGTDPSDQVIADNRLDIGPEAIEGGFRIAGGIGYWNCCVLIEPAMMFRANRPFGDERTDDTPIVFDPSEPDIQNEFAELEVKHGWELGFGPQMTWMIRDDTPLLGSHLGLSGLPLVFFPFIGVGETEWEAELQFNRNSPTALDRDFEDDLFIVGFDLDLPLPGSRADFTHALTFGFRWVEGDDQHDMGPFAAQNIGDGDLGTSVSGACGDGSDGPERACFTFEGTDGWRVGLYYRVTWNDFEGFVKRNIFGPVQ